MLHRLYLLFSGLTLGLLVSSVLTSPLWAENQKVTLSERSLKNWLLNESPQFKMSQLKELDPKAQKKKFEDSFNWSAQAQANYGETKESLLNQFTPVIRESHNSELGIQKNTQFGASFAVKAFNETFTNNFIQDGSTSGASFSFSLDLYKNIFGKLTDSQRKNLELAHDKGKWEKELQESLVLIQVRKIYWSLVANSESLKVSRKLLKTALTQAQDARRRYRSKVADQGEVARYESQVAARRARLTALKNERSQLLRALKEFLPNMAHKNLELAPYSIPQAINTVLACTQKIKSKEEVPLDYTLYDEIVETLNGIHDKRQEINDAYDKMDLKLASEVRVLGKDFGVNDSLSDLQDRPRHAWNVGLTLNIPLDDKKKSTQEVLESIDKIRLKSKRQELLARIRSYHNQTVESVDYLQEMVRNQKVNSEKLKTALRITRKKYNQARISVRELITEQDALLNSDLSVISTQLEIIHTVLDYLAIFTQTPCELNRI